MNDVMTKVKPAQPTALTPGMKGADRLTALARVYSQAAIASALRMRLRR